MSILVSGITEAFGDRSHNDPGQQWTAAALLIDAQAILSSTKCSEIFHKFSEVDAPPAFAVVDRMGDQAPTKFGLIDKVSFLSMFAKRFGPEIFAKRPISVLMEEDPLVFPDTAPIEAISTAITTRRPSALHSGFIITHDGKYAGIGLGLDLVRLIAARAEAAYQQLAEAQESLVEAEKFASLGQLVAGIAHEVNTPIGVALTAATHLEQRTAEIHNSVRENQLRRDDFTNYLAVASDSTNIVAQNLHHAARLIRSFKQVAVDQSSMHRHEFLLDRLIGDVVTSLSANLKRKNITVEVNCPPAIEMTSCPGSLGQILTNLFMNALTHAFEDRDAGTIRIRVESRDHSIVISFSDDGAGIEPANLKRIFEPFFTTKRGRGGSGLGLHIVYNLVTQSLMGSVRCRSVVGQGTTFVMVLPRVREETESPDFRELSHVSQS
jgi:signal transduction histidine kinase